MQILKDNLLTMLRESFEDKENPLYEAMFSYNYEPISLCEVIEKIKQTNSEKFFIKLTTKDQKKLTIIIEK